MSDGKGSVSKGGAEQRFLLPPDDPLLLLSSPPCSPLPADWDLQVEDAPHAEPERFDLDGGGLVSLGDGRMIDLGNVPGVGAPFIRRGAIVAHLNPLGQSGGRQGPSSYRVLPPIIIDSYE